MQTGRHDEASSSPFSQFCERSLILHSAHIVHLCVLHSAQNKQRLFPCIAFSDSFFCNQKVYVYCVVGNEF
jgi:hypothetical protein